RDDLDGKHRALVPCRDVGPDTVADERADRVAPGEFSGRQQGIQAKVISRQGHAGLQSSSGRSCNAAAANPLALSLAHCELQRTPTGWPLRATGGCPPPLPAEAADAQPC